MSLAAVDLFSGAGGASLGFLQAGFRMLAAVDIDRRACGTYARNIPGVEVLREDVRGLSGEDVLSSVGLGVGEVDVAVGCPPCQGFTDHGKPGDPRNSLVMEFARLISEMRPRAVVFENVPGMLKRGWPLLAGLMDGLGRAGYRYSWDVLNAADYGVPQIRRRIVLVAVRADLGVEPSLPKPTHARPDEAGRLGLRPWRTVREAIADLPPLGPGERHPTIPNHEAPGHSPRVLELIRRVPKDGGSRKDVPRRYWLRCHRNHDGHHDVYGRMRWDSPAPTITSGCYTPSKGRFIHPEQDRGITMREAARLQGFPDDFVFEGPRQAVARQIGNALPPPLARSIAEAVAEVLSRAP
ncbi:MAG: DNA cytosine methyltransferase [Candidatus Korarchaeota archaeon]|nr:DNA cytosine methyltransferase [Candidatus Korarchaeota archaeon]